MTLKSGHKLRFKEQPFPYFGSMSGSGSASRTTDYADHNDEDGIGGDRTSNISKHSGKEKGRKWASSDEDDISEDERRTKKKQRRKHKHDSYREKPETEAPAGDDAEQAWRQKMFDALHDDANGGLDGCSRIDGVEAHFNEYSHSYADSAMRIPNRWKPLDEDTFVKVDPNTLDEESYAEWVRMGMYRKTHAAEYAASEARKAARQAREDERKARAREGREAKQRAEAEERQQAETRSKRKEVEENEQREALIKHAWAEYTRRWDGLQRASLNLPGIEEPGDDSLELKFRDVPWPVVASYRHRRAQTDQITVCVKNFTKESVEEFVHGTLRLRLSSPLSTFTTQPSTIPAPPTLKSHTRDFLLRFHPDKFEGRYIRHVVEDDRERVREGVRVVVGILNGIS